MIDLHTHTTCSDGSDNPKEVVQKAKEKGISILSITDHNTVDGYGLLDKEDYDAITIIPGVEITTTYKGQVIEVLGYGFDLFKMNDLLNKNVLTFEQKQLKEFELISLRYKKIGLKFDLNNIKFNSKKESCRSYFCSELKKYEENKKYFSNDNIWNIKKGFTRKGVYNPNSKLYVDESYLYPSLEKTIDIIHESGGVAFLAHTFSYSSSIYNELDNILDNYKLDGLECFYTTFTDEQTNILVDKCRERNLLMSGGSDYHGTRKINHNLGVGHGNLSIDESKIGNWFDLCKKMSF